MAVCPFRPEVYVAGFMIEGMSATTEPAPSARAVLVARTHRDARQVALRWSSALPELVDALPMATTQGDRAWHGVSAVHTVYVAPGAGAVRVPYRMLLSALTWRLRGRPVFHFLPVDPAEQVVTRSAVEVLDELRRAEPVLPEDIAG